MRSVWNRRVGTGPPALNSVAVLPFESSAQDPDIEYIADGLTDGLIDHLARAKSLKVQARATVMRFKGNPNPREAARALGVGAVVTGALSRRGTQIVVSAELIHGATGERLWGQTFDRPLADLMRVQDSIVLSIAEGLRLRLSGEEKARLGGFGTDNPEAYELFLKGRFLMQRETEEDDLEALRLFKLAAEKDPNFLDAHLAVATTYGRMVGGGLQSSRDAGGHADEALAKAFAIDPNNVGVRVAMAQKRFVTKHDWAATEREYRAVMDDPTVLRTTHVAPDRPLLRGHRESRRSRGVGRARARRRSRQPRVAGNAREFPDTGDLIACGDKFLVAGRGTRYQRPKTARAASVLIYADPASAVAASLKKAKVESVLKLEGHRATRVQSLEELSAVVSSGRFDVILTATSDSANVQRLVQTSRDAATVLAVDDLVKDRSLLQAIDTAVSQRDQNLKKTRSS